MVPPDFIQVHLSNVSLLRFTNSFIIIYITRIQKFSSRYTSARFCCDARMAASTRVRPLDPTTPVVSRTDHRDVFNLPSVSDRIYSSYDYLNFVTPGFVMSQFPTCSRISPSVGYQRLTYRFSGCPVFRITRVPNYTPPLTQQEFQITHHPIVDSERSGRPPPHEPCLVIVSP